MIKKRSVWLHELKNSPGASRRHLYCFPFAGGSSISFQAWLPFLPVDMNLSVIFLPGRGQRMAEPALTDLRAMADIVAREMRPQLADNSIFYGHSMGAALAYEVALRLEDSSPVRHLFCGALRAPHLAPLRQAIHNLPDPDFLACLKSFGATPAEVLTNQELMAMLLPMLRADFKAIETYRLTTVTRINSPLTFFYGLDDDTIGLEQIKDWALYTRQNFQMHGLKGGHFFLDGQGSAILDIIDRSA